MKAELGSAKVLLPAISTSASPEQHQAHRQTWLTLRRPGIGASEIAAVLGISPWASRFSLWWAKREGWDFEQNESQEWGLRSEPMIALKFTEEHPDLHVIRPDSLYAHKRHSHMLCSPDRLAILPDGRVIPIELKTDEAGHGWGEPGTDQVPLHYAVQVQWQAGVFGSPYGYLVRYARKRYTEYVVLPDPRISVWIKKAAGFLQSIVDDNPPDPDGHEATTDTLTKIHIPDDKEPPIMFPDDVVAEYERLVNLERTTKEDLEVVKNHIRNQLGKSTEGVTTDGRTFVTRIRYDRRSYTVKETTVDQLRRKKS
jgi:putative phage-type endonuclease